MSEVFKHTTTSPEETEALGASFVAGLDSGAVVGLIGELGAGKTRFVRGMASGLGARGFVKSPSFTIVNIYEGGRYPLYHMDLYRIGKADEFYEAGLEEFIYGEGISVIEWTDKLPSLTAECTHIVRLEYGSVEGERLISIETIKK